MTIDPAALALARQLVHHSDDCPATLAEDGQHDVFCEYAVILDGAARKIMAYAATYAPGSGRVPLGLTRPAQASLGRAREALAALDENLRQMAIVCDTAATPEDPDTQSASRPAPRPVPPWWRCQTHGPATPNAWGCPECVRELRAEPKAREGVKLALEVLKSCIYQAMGQATVPMSEARIADLRSAASMIQRVAEAKGWTPSGP